MFLEARMIERAAGVIQQRQETFVGLGQLHSMLRQCAAGPRPGRRVEVTL